MKEQVIIEEMVIKDYLNLLATKNPVPGGGSVAGVNAAQGIGLVLMVLNLTEGKEKYKEFEDGNLKVKEEALELFEYLKKAADDDVLAFSKVAEAYKIPKNDPNKPMEIGKASLGATKAPFQLMVQSLEGCKLIEKLIGKTNKTAISDLAVAAFCFESAAKSAWLNVKINLSFLLDENDQKYFETNGQKILDEIAELSSDVNERILELLQEKLFERKYEKPWQ